MEPGEPSSLTVPPRTHQASKHSRVRRPSEAKSTKSAKSAKSIRSTVESPSLPKSPNPQPPSPEVISSLISSLAAISAPAEHHFDQLPKVGSKVADLPEPAPGQRKASKVTSPEPFFNTVETVRHPSLQQGFGADYGAYQQPEEIDQESYLAANTAHAPVVRMSKPRAASSRSRSRTPTLRESQQSLQSRDETASIGQLSTEPGLLPSSASVSSSKGGGISRILGSRRSKDTILNGQRERTTSIARNGDKLSPMSSNLRHSSSKKSLIDMTIDQSPSSWQSSPASAQTPRQERKFSNTSMTPSSSRTPDRPGGIGSGRIIPSRQSSLHHNTASSPGSKVSKSLKHSRGNKHLRIGQDVPEEEDSTVKRIRELQKQKEKREKEQKKEERKAEKKRPRSSMPAPLPYRTSSKQSSRHSMTDIMSMMPDQPAPLEEYVAPAPVFATSNGRRMSVGQYPLHAGRTSEPNFQSIRIEPRPSMGSRPVTPSMHQRPLSEMQYSPSRGSLGIERPGSADSIDDAVKTYLASPRLTQRLRHPETGRVITFSEVGDPRGFPVICCVGMGMTRYIMAFYDELAITLRLRLITIDRPGVGESGECSDGTGTPLNWPDDVLLVCHTLSISKFSLLAHSAGAIYALATALRLPQHIRGRLHLLAPWIPPSQISSIGSQNDALPSNSVPYAQKLLRVLPASFLRAANSSFLSSTTSSIIHKSPKRSRWKNGAATNETVDLRSSSPSGPWAQGYPGQPSLYSANTSFSDLPTTINHALAAPARDSSSFRASPTPMDDNFIRARRYAYDSLLTKRIWDLSQRHANPAVDLLICIERLQDIGFRYVDITRACVFHHGNRDTRVPLENVQWLAKKMRRCEVRILPGEGHSLMASAKIMAEILTEIAREWEDWTRVTREGRGRRVFYDEFDE